MTTRVDDDGLDWFSPHAAALGITFVSGSTDAVTLKVPYAEHLVGDPDTGVVHGGVMTALLDNCSGRAVRAAVTEAAPGELSMATLDLRIDYMGPAPPGEDIYAVATCFKRTRNIAFVARYGLLPLSGRTRSHQRGDVHVHLITA